MSSLFARFYAYRAAQNGISANISAQNAACKGDWIQPLVGAINCTLWVVYGLWRPKKDISGAVANAPGILFGGVVAITALI
ncbi:hypothetical protein [uncultured Rothia sp.]|uniref:hypothetical protein n=1 Tax=uncultured Rothia sp. TaxID=316088 RepID=UPI0025F3B0B8|nr:hypothetical protein [uncultured Rothia sp.]